MWIPRKYLIKMIDRQNDLERRVKRFGSYSFRRCKKNKIASLRKEETDCSSPNAFLTIEEIVKSRT